MRACELGCQNKEWFSNNVTRSLGDGTGYVSGMTYGRVSTPLQMNLGDFFLTRAKTMLS